MRGPCEESLLNRLLNEMDGLRDSAPHLRECPPEAQSLGLVPEPQSD
jgi:hypothetical protein